jgi:hypothetical protein
LNGDTLKPYRVIRRFGASLGHKHCSRCIIEILDEVNTLAINNSRAMDTLTKRLAGPSTGKAGMDTVDQSKVNDIIYKASEVYPIA